MSTENINAICEAVKKPDDEGGLHLRAFLALNDLSNYYSERMDARRFRVNACIHALWDIPTDAQHNPKNPKAKVEVK